MKAKCKRDTVDGTINTLYDVYGIKESVAGTHYLVLTDSRDQEIPRWMPAELYDCDTDTPPSGWVRKEKNDTRGDKTVVSSYPMYFEFEKDIIKGTVRGSMMFNQMRSYPTEGYGIQNQVVTQAIKQRSTKKSSNQQYEEHEMKQSHEDETMYLSRTVANEVIGITNTLSEVMQWRIGSALQGDVYEMTSNVAAAKGSLDEYDKRMDLEAARSKLFVVRNALGILPDTEPSSDLHTKINELLIAIDNDLEAVKLSIHEQEKIAEV